MDIKQHNSFKAMLVSGKQKKNPDKTWQGLAITAVVDGVTYTGIIFPKRDNDIMPDKEIKF